MYCRRPQPPPHFHQPAKAIPAGDAPPKTAMIYQNALHDTYIDIDTPTFPSPPTRGMNTRRSIDPTALLLPLTCRIEGAKAYALEEPTAKK